MSESGKVFKTNKGKVLMFKESTDEYQNKINAFVDELDKYNLSGVQLHFEGNGIWVNVRGKTPSDVI